MPSSQEIEQMLTGPGGAFEVTTETVRGVEMKVFKDRMKSLREIFPMAAMRGDGDGATHIVYGDRRIGFGEFVEGANRVAAALAARPASGGAIASPCCRPTTPSGSHVLGGRSISAPSSSASTDGGRPTRSSTASRTRAPRCSSPTAAATSGSTIRSTGSGSRRSSSSRTTSTSCSSGPRRRCLTCRSTRTSPPSSSTRAARPAGPRARSRRTGR